MTAPRRAAIVVLCLFLAACRGAAGTEPPLKELQRVKAGDLEAVVLADHADVKPGKDTWTLEFRGATGELHDVGAVTATASMPMPGMGPMLGTIAVVPGETPGRYTVTTDLAMSGGWQIAISWVGPAGKGTARFQQPVR
jgi:hypothetical protein